MLVIVDTREKRTPNACKIIEKLKNNRIIVEFASLPYGDYFIPGSIETKQGYIVERKTIFDLINSIKNRRLFEQLKNLSSGNETPILVIEGSLAVIKKFSDFNEEAIMGIILSCIEKFGVETILVPSYYWTYLLIKQLVKRAQKSEKIKYKSLKTRKLPKTTEEQAIFFLSSLPGISEVRAREILKRFGNPLEALNKYRSWKIIPGIGENLIEKVRKVLLYNFRNHKK